MPNVDRTYTRAWDLQDEALIVAEELVKTLSYHTKDSREVFKKDVTKTLLWLGTISSPPGAILLFPEVFQELTTTSSIMVSLILSGIIAAWFKVIISVIQRSLEDINHESDVYRRHNESIIKIIQESGFSSMDENILDESTDIHLRVMILLESLEILMIDTNNNNSLN